MGAQAAQHHGESDLVYRDGTWFLIATCEIPSEPTFEPSDWVGVDRGINNLATTSDGDNFSGRRLSRDRVTVSRDQRARQSSWPFHQLGEFIAYKARRTGVPVVVVDPAHTSQRCPRCGHTDRANRLDRDHFRCRRCGLAGPADLVAAVNIRNRARRAWVFVNMPAPDKPGRVDAPLAPQPAV